MERRSAARPLLLGLLLAVLAAPGVARAELWRWVDEDGVARFTPDPDRVPVSRRSTLARVEAGMPSVPQPEAAAARPPAIFAPPGDPALAEDPFNAPERAREVRGEVVGDPGEVVVEVPSAAPPRPTRPAPSSPTSESAPPNAAAPERPAAPLATAPRPTSPEAVAGPPAPRALPPEREARRAELAAEIARDEETLKAHVSSSGDASVVDTPELREIAERLPALQAELRALEAQSAAP
jgi:hypothetical protein